MEIGTVISTLEGPSPNTFAFVVNEQPGQITVRQNQFVELKTTDGKMVAMVQNLIKTNRYFERAESVREYERSGTPMSSTFPIDRWEYLVAEAQPLGVYTGNLLQRATFPPSPGMKVHEAKNETLKDFLGLSDNGLEIGQVEHHKLPVKLDMTRLVQKHFCLLGLSGSGKSYLASAILEELLDRKRGDGRIALFIIDVHGEYVGFAEDPQYSKKVKVIKGQQIRIGTSNLNAYGFADLMPKMSSFQVRDLNKVINKMKSKKRDKPYNLDNLVEAVQESEEIRENTSGALIGWLMELKQLKLFNYSDFPACQELKPGEALILDLSDITNLRKKQAIVAYFSRKYFNLRKNGLIPPYVEVLEEAHQFAPEGVKKEGALSKSILQTIAREGRKFYASLCLISQRPIQLSTTILSQANTHFIMRVTNPYDLKHIGESSEGITKRTLDTISSLRVGEGLIVGEAVNFPVFVKVRERRSNPPNHSRKLEDYAAEYEKKVVQKSKDAETFM